MIETDFPIYRKYPNDKAFFRIESERSFTEIQFTAGKKETFRFEAKIFPDFQRIRDMVEMTGGYWVPCTEGEIAKLF